MCKSFQAFCINLLKEKTSTIIHKIQRAQTNTSNTLDVELQFRETTRGSYSKKRIHQDGWGWERERRPQKWMFPYSRCSELSGEPFGSSCWITHCNPLPQRLNNYSTSCRPNKWLWQNAERSHSEIPQRVSGSLARSLCSVQLLQLFKLWLEEYFFRFMYLTSAQTHRGKIPRGKSLAIAQESLLLWRINFVSDISLKIP